MLEEIHKRFQGHHGVIALEWKSFKGVFQNMILEAWAPCCCAGATHTDWPAASFLFFSLFRQLINDGTETQLVRSTAS